jgi:mitogen-activated protein kinase kinase kinase
MGSFGSVYLGMNRTSGELMAVKQVELPSHEVQGEQRKQSMLIALQREIALLRDLTHENIVHYIGRFPQ